MSKKQPVRPLSGQPTSKTSAKTISFLQAKWIGWVLAVFVFVAVVSYFFPVLQGKGLGSHDTDQYQAMYKEIKDYQEKGETILWTTKLFSGMPATLIGIPTYNIFTYAWGYTNELIPSPLAEFLLIAFSAFFIFKILGFGYLECFVVAIIMGFSSANFISVSAGHLTKVRAIAMVPVLVGSAWLALNRRWLFGGILFTIALGLQISFNHVQITYYTFFILGIMFIASVVHAGRKKTFPILLKGAALMAMGVVLAGALNSALLFNTLDYSKESIRGKRILPEQVAEGQANASKSGDEGVGIDYATNWSQGIGESMTFLIPNFYGGGSSGSLGDNSNTYKILTAKGIPPTQAAGFASQLPTYWGDQPFVAGPIYFGAIVILLFVLGLFLVKGNHKWWILAAVIFTLFVSFGKNTLWFYKILYNVLPMFNKFRSPTMILSLTQMLMAGLGIMGIAVLLKGNLDKSAVQRALKVGGGIVIGICLFFALLGGSVMSFTNTHKEDPSGPSTDQQFVEQLKQSVGDEAFANEIYSGIKKDRKALMSKDAIRSAIFVGLALVLLYLATMGRVPVPVAVLGVAFLALVDLWGVNQRYLNEKNFSDQYSETGTLYSATEADRVIQQYGANARMLDITVNMFNDASPSYFHQNIGGYHPAKLRRYQDLVERGISKDMASLNVTGLANIPVLNMLNMKFLKTGPEAQKVVQNPGAFGNAWLVDSVVTVNTDEEEINSLHKYDLAKNAIVHKDFADMLKEYRPAPGQTGDTISLKSFHPNKVEYSYSISSPRVAVFSEIIYKPNVDWTSAIDGKDHPHFRANYALRAMYLPAGQHTVTFTFMPKVFATTKLFSLAGSGIFLLLIGFAIYMSFRPAVKPESPG